MPLYSEKDILQSAFPPTPDSFSQAVNSGLGRALAGERRRTSHNRLVGMLSLAACCLFVVLFVGAWTIDPAMADGISFRQGILSFFNKDERVQALVEPPLPTQSAMQGELPSVELGVYRVTLSETIFDGNNLYLGYTVCMTDGSALPPDMFTQDQKSIDSIMIDGLRIDGTDDFFTAAMRSSSMDVDPFERHTSLEIELEGLLDQHPITDESDLELVLANYRYEQEPNNENELNSTLLGRASLPFRVNTRNQGVARTITPIQKIHDFGDWQLEILRIEVSPLVTRLHYLISGQLSAQQKGMNAHMPDEKRFVDHTLIDDSGNRYDSSGASSTGQQDEQRFIREGTIDFSPLEGATRTLTLTFDVIDYSGEELVQLPSLYPPIVIELP